MSGYLQIDGDPTKWWPAQPFQASQLTGQPLSIAVTAPTDATLVLSGKAASVAVFDLPSGQGAPGSLYLQAPSIYLPTGAGLSAGHVGYELPANVNLANLADEIVASIQNGHSQTVPLGGPSGGALVLNGATLSFVVLCAVGTAPVTVGGSVPHD